MIRTAALLAATLVLASAAARAQTYPSKPITLVDSVRGRRFQRHHRPRHRQEAVRKLGSAGGGRKPLRRRRPDRLAVVAAAAPDGYTLLLVSSTFTINPAIKKSMPFDTIKDFTPVAFIARSPLLLTASNNLAVKSAKELLALAKSKPGQITYASAGPGSINQIAAELIALSAGVKLMHVPYRGGAPALNDLLGGHVDIYVSSLPQVLQLAQSGQANALAVTSVKRTRAAA